MKQKIVPCLFFENQAEEAMNFYTGIFRDGKVISISRYPDEPLRDWMAGTEGLVLTAVFELAGYRFMALDGASQFSFTPAVSFFVDCQDEAEIDTLWQALATDGTVLMPLQDYGFSPKFGWVQDRFGVSWQLKISSAAQSIAPFLTFVGGQHGRAEEAIDLYTSLFTDSSIVEMYHYGDDGEGEPGTVQYAQFQLEGQTFHTSDADERGGPHEFAFNEAISFHVECADQAEVDRLWTALSVVPEAEVCGWLKDRFGVSWQIIPTALIGYMDDADKSRTRRVMDVMLEMKKIDTEPLQKAYEG